MNFEEVSITFLQHTKQILLKPCFIHGLKTIENNDFVNITVDDMFQLNRHYNHIPLLHGLRMCIAINSTLDRWHYL